jgi:hypothetical protein
MKQLNLTGVLLFCAVALIGCVTEPESIRNGAGGGAIVIGGSSSSAPPASRPMAPPAGLSAMEDFQDEEGLPDVTHPPGQDIGTPEAVIEKGEWSEDMTVGEWHARQERCNLKARQLSKDFNLNITVSSVETMGLDQWGNKYVRCRFKREASNDQLELFDNPNQG